MGSKQHLDHLVLRLSTLKPPDFLGWGRGTCCVVLHRTDTGSRQKKQTCEIDIGNKLGNRHRAEMR